MKISSLLFLVLLSALCVFAEGSYAATVDVSIINFSFQPQAVSVTVGDTVRWTNNDSGFYGGPILHSTTSGTSCISNRIWDSGLLTSGQAFSFTFTQPGVYPYFCSIHCFVGMVTVNAAAAVPLPVGQPIFPYPPVGTPVVSTTPSVANPVGIGALAQGGPVLTVQLDIAQFAGPVDIYAAVMVTTNPQIISNVKPDLTFQAFTVQQVLQALATGQPPAGAVPLMANVTTAVNTTLFAGIPVSSLSPGTYTLFLLVTLPGNLSNFYLWETTFTI